MFEECVLEPGTLRLLRSLGRLPELEAFFLVGGTALAIQIGHRKSVDLDFFTLESFDAASTLGAIRGLADGEVVVVGEAPNSLNLVVQGVKVDLLRHGYELVEGLLPADGYWLAHPSDIAAMKLSAVTNRGSRKDFVDLFFLLRSFSLVEMLGYYERKYPMHDVFPVLKSLAYFFSRDSIFSARSLLPSMRRRKWTKVRMMAMLTWTARLSCAERPIHLVEGCGGAGGGARQAGRRPYNYQSRLARI